jgi:FkbM family methyltransferase
MCAVGCNEIQNPEGEGNMGINLFQTLGQVGLPAPRGILQVGASYGQEFKDFLENGVKCGVLIEPLPEPYAHLSSLCKQVAGFVAFNALCSDNAGEKHTFHVASNGGMSSSIMKPKGHLEMFDYVKFEQAIELVSTTADDILIFLARNGHEAVVQGLDTLYMDVQGAEFKVLLGAPRTLKQVNYIFMELIRGDLYEGAVPLATYCALLEAQGFTLNNINFNAQHHADALFVRKSLVGLK